jgi:hypothetical protein
VSARRVLPLLLAAVTLTGCVTPAPDSGAYRQNARGALDSGITHTSTAALTVRQRLAGKVTGPYTDVLLTDSERAIGPIEDSFSAPQPPHAPDDRLRTSVRTLLGSSEDAISLARIAARRDDRPGLRSALRDLDAALRGLRTARAAMR